MEKCNKNETISIVGKSDAIFVDGCMAIACVEKYCGQLPQDLFTFLCPEIFYKKFGEMKRAFLKLPFNSGIPDVIEVIYVNIIFQIVYILHTYIYIYKL